MTVLGEDYWITFNGEIYNYLELRAELQQQGYQFRTDSDVEVLIQAYAAWGISCLDRCIGMFAFALWDQRRRRLWCVRDRLGVKPFYYALSGDTFAFSSEMKALRALAPDACQPDMDQLFWFLHYGQVYNAPHTFYTGVRELPGGHYLLFEDGKVAEPVRWWDVDLGRARATFNYDNVEDEFLRLMRDSVKLRLRSDVPVGTCLSGGLDSSTIVALATEALNGGRMNSFSAVYPVKGLDEGRYVDIVASEYQTIAHRITPPPDDFLTRLQEITWHQDIPTGASGVYTQNFVMQLAHENVTVLLDGQGADELFAGYLSHVVLHLHELRRSDPSRWLLEQAVFLLDMRSSFNPALNWREFAFRVRHHLIGGNRPLHLLRPEYEALAGRRQAASSGRLALEGADVVNCHLYRELISTSIPALLHYEDRNSMSYGIEARVPFLDHRMVEFALAIPSGRKIEGAKTKVVMRQALRGVLPSAIIDRKDKLGYPTPFAQWLRGPLRKVVEEYLHDQVLKREWYDASSVRQIWKAHTAGRRNLEATIYRMITAEQWYTQQTK